MYNTPEAYPFPSADRAEAEFGGPPRVEDEFNFESL